MILTDVKYRACVKVLPSGLTRFVVFFENLKSLGGVVQTFEISGV